MTFDRRTLLSAGLGAGGLIAAAQAASAGARPVATAAAASSGLGLEPNSPRDQTAALQAAIDAAATRGEPLRLPAGRFRAGAIVLRPGSCLVGAAGMTVLEFAGGASFITANGAHGACIEDLELDGAMLALDPARAEGLLHLNGSERVLVRNVTATRSLLSGIVLRRCSGRIAECSVTHVGQAGIHSRDATGLEIAHNTVTDCANNGIQVWRSEAGEDGTIVSTNRIERIAAKSGGSGQNGNGVNVFRAGGVLVTGNRIADCAYSAIRANAASNIQMVANSCARIGEVALYAEFGFEGALIASNIVDTAASGIAVTNFNEGGRLAVVQGNLIRNLARREQEPEDKRGVGISVEADSLVTGNTIENAATCGIAAGWRRHLRNCAVTQNLVRKAPVGILVSDSAAAGSALVSGNMIAETSNGAIRMMDASGEPVGPELAGASDLKARVAIAGNVATGSSGAGWFDWMRG